MTIAAMFGIEQLALPKIIRELIGVAGFRSIATQYEKQKHGERD
jgi:uncharacterized membrane protein YuzA (DUF378 family)